MALRNLLTVGSLVMALAACGGGGSGSGSGSADSGAGTGGTTSSTIKGVVAMGLPLVGAVVTVTDSTGKLCLSTIVMTDDKGYYEADTSKCAPPMVVRATGVTTANFQNTGAPYTWESVSVTNNAVINITPITMTISSAALGGVPTSTWEATNLRSTPTELAKKLKDAQDAVIAAMRAANIDVPNNFDFVHTPFAADGTGIDAIMDGIKVTHDSKTGNTTVHDKTGTVTLFTVNASTGAVTPAAGAAVWPDYLVFNSLSAGTPRELGTDTAAVADDTAIYTPASAAKTALLTFTKRSQADITVTGNYDRTSGSIAPLAGQSGNERLDGQLVAICTGGSAYVMLSKAATVVPLSDLVNGPAMKMEEIGVSEGCPLTGANAGPIGLEFSGKGGDVKTPDGVMTAAGFLSSQKSTIAGPAGYDRFLAFKVSVGGTVRYGMIERGLDGASGQAPFLYMHVQKD
jgi:hypothetical protein